MAEIFISYKSERRAAAEHFAEVLRRHGFTVWFDYELVKGADFAAQIERQIRGARALVALWCSLSVTSRWVREEVYLAHDLGRLVPVKIEACEIPFGFRLADTIDLTAWDGAPRSPALDPLIDALEGRIKRDAAPDRRALIEYEGAWRRFGGHPLKDFAVNTALSHTETRRFGPEGENGPPVLPHAAEQAGAPENGLLQWSKEEWERLKDSADIAQLRHFAKHAHPYYVAEALALAKAKEQAEAAGRRREREAAKAAGADTGGIPWKPAALLGAVAVLALTVYLWPRQAERGGDSGVSLPAATAPARPALSPPSQPAEATPPSGERAAKPLSQAAASQVKKDNVAPGGVPAPEKCDLNSVEVADYLTKVRLCATMEIVEAQNLSECRNVTKFNEHWAEFKNCSRFSRCNKDFVPIMPRRIIDKAQGETILQMHDILNCMSD